MNDKEALRGIGVFEFKYEADAEMRKRGAVKVALYYPSSVHRNSRVLLYSAHYFDSEGLEIGYWMQPMGTLFLFKDRRVWGEQAFGHYVVRDFE